MNPKDIPDPPDFLIIFQRLCENYADEVDGKPRQPKSNRGTHECKLLEFCHAYAYKINGIESWE